VNVRFACDKRLPASVMMRTHPGADRDSFLDTDGNSLRVSWPYDRTETLADGIIHIAGLVLALIAATALVIFAYRSSTGFEAASVAIYACFLLTMLGLSAAYNMWPISPRKWSLRRLDHSAIFLFIAATYTPLIAQTKFGERGLVFLIAIWVLAALGVMLKYFFPGRFDRLSIVLCLGLGGSGVLAYDSVEAYLPSATLWLIAIGGGIYAIGIIFHLWERLRFQNAIWHGLVLIAAGCHYAAIVNCIAVASA
jgi:hemolysin III